MFGFDLGVRVLGWVLPVVLGPVVYLFARELLNATRRVDDLPPIAKRASVIALGLLVSALLNAVGVAVPPECFALPNEITSECANALNAPTVVRGISAALVAMLIHAVKKAKPNT